MGVTKRKSVLIMKNLRTFFLISVILTPIYTTAAQGTNNSVVPPVTSVSIKAELDSAKVGFPVMVKVVLTNISNHDLTITREARGGDCLFDVRDEKGILAPDTRFGYIRNHHVADPDPARINPQDLNVKFFSGILKAGETDTWKLHVGQLYDLSRAGKYKILLRRMDDETKKTVESNAITVIVTP